MRKLAPMFITTSILALAAGTAFANTSDVNATDKNGQPTVSSNTNKQPLSYSDKSSTAKGTNAKMDDKSTTAAGDTTLDQAAGTTTNHEGVKAKAKRAKAKVASKMHTMKHKATTTTARDDSVSSMPTAKPSPSSDNPPMSATQGEAANSMTGKSAGQ